MAEKPLSAADQEKLIDEAQAAGEMPEPPPYIVMEDQNKERFDEMMKEGQAEGGGIEMAQGLMAAITGLPGKIVDRIQDE